MKTNMMNKVIAALLALFLMSSCAALKKFFSKEPRPVKPAVVLVPEKSETAPEKEKQYRSAFSVQDLINSAKQRKRKSTKKQTLTAKADLKADNWESSEKVVIPMVYPPKSPEDQPDTIKKITLKGIKLLTIKKQHND